MKQDSTMKTTSPAGTRDDARSPRDLGKRDAMIPASVREKTIPIPSRVFLTEILRDGAQRLLAQAIDAKVTEWIDRHAEVVDDAGRHQVVRNGHHPTRTLARIFHNCPSQSA